MKDPEKEATWKLLVTFGDPKYGHEGKAKVSPDTLRLAYPYRRSENNADALCTYEWSRSKTQNFTQYRSRDGQYSERAALTCDIVKSIFENGPIFLTETEANGNQSSLMLLRY